ncbi:CobQ-like glutamine amidotransferase family enzyme [Okibacterium sp. HSC-33S16]|uniref:type 1 glutamine amidotransferase n=1 Tax=Okibacterium sp. HSC-33S16 TaxID=2910965 RepID=UPI0020A16291|nr:cobyric acid synthase [Okibacterium sp. HSC-33S16]MCP2030779.1 CobQ-like glutamine amidotransferase family enzyme [Okibacterium sp. HSC-33S16]
MTISVLELYPAHLSLNGDVGNRTALVRRMRLAGIDVAEHAYHPGDTLPDTPDIVTIGTGTSSAQRSLASDIARLAPLLAEWSEAGVVIFAAGAGFHLLSASVRFGADEVIPGAGVFAGSADASRPRIITEAFAVESDFGLLIGTENHTSVFVGRPDQKPIGRVRHGVGNGDGTDGAVVNNSFGTHLHGPALVLNPSLADHLIGLATGRAGVDYVRSGEHDALDKTVELARSILINKLPSSGQKS